MATQTKNISSNLMATQNELDRIQNALEDGEFRQLLVQYAREVSEPDNQALYEREVVALERARGYAVHFLHPQPGFVIKTTNLRNDEKIFINVCTESVIDVASSSEAGQGLRSQVPPVPGSGGGEPSSAVRWSIPYSLSQGPRKDVDRGGRPCTVFDVIVHPDTLALAQGQPRMKQLVADTALEAVEKAHALKLEHHGVRYPKMKFKGTFQPTVIRRPLKPGRHEPHYEIRYRHAIRDVPTNTYQYGDGPRGRRIEDPCRPTHLLVEVELPEFDTMQGVDLDVTPTQLTLESSGPAAYYLSIPLNYVVNEEEGQAKFDKSTKKLTVTLPVQAHKDVERHVSTDSGIDVDSGYAACTEDEPHENGSRSGPRILPNYTCNIYEDVLVFTLDVKNVDESSLVKTVLSDETFGFDLGFSTSGCVSESLHYGFKCALLFEEEPLSPLATVLDAIEVEVWDNNVIIKVSMPGGVLCDQYKIGIHDDDMTAHAIPQLKAFRKRREQLLKTSPTHEGNRRPRTYSESLGDAFEDLCLEVGTSSKEDNKERHNSGESEDSVLEDSRFSVTPSSLQHIAGPEPKPIVLPNGQEVRSILKRAVKRCFSESHTDLLSWQSDSSSSSQDSNESCNTGSEADSVISKRSVRFNETVQRQIFRPNSSILGQKHKNQKKNNQKKRKAARRASEGDAASSVNSNSDHQGDDEDMEEDDDDHLDSGVASSVDDADTIGGKESKAGMSWKKGKKNNAGKGKNKGNLAKNVNDLMFELDF
ncbi:hypothetical protein TCAL_02164 [Tigriopus californicus]|uniref:Protein kintoun n=1 Tax=Tigriopus californicus TaxID=6832 RepID=A0A553N7U5_TIGCA|nr:protein kintoun-like [Tigriopus californicus]TRY61480.1 hypothetical protein TCAL_02164 [Tigriopus californicus]|eukprot:TCALIF_02164-PA protein Name:"Similar to Ppi20 Protein kintoun (Drosophila erecta)" AED:0.12 eAED:0.12 QI:1417/1/1/1/1/1/2/332/759